MAENVLEYLENAAKCFPNREAYEDAKEPITFSKLQSRTRAIGTGLARENFGTGKPVPVFLEKGVEAIVAFFGVVYSGNFYCPLDTAMPKERLALIFRALQPERILTDGKHKAQVESMVGTDRVLLVEELQKEEADPERLLQIRRDSTKTDPLYILFTSGSTGTPKGVLIPHRVILNYMAWMGKTFPFDETTVFGNQAPLYFDVSCHDVYGALFFGAKTVLIPPAYFTFPVRLIEFLNEKKISTIFWVPTALCIIANLKAFRVEKPAHLTHILFAGEVMPPKQLAYWRSALPDAVYVNGYGLTEAYGCLRYISDGQEPEGAVLPIGKPIANVIALVLDEEGHPVPQGEVGELCVGGDCLAIGYWQDPKKNQEAFLTYPSATGEAMRLYKTGDLAYQDEKGNFVYVSRKDFQIKHKGYRIELGEIENVANLIEGIEECGCIYDGKKQRIVLFYQGKEWERKALLAQLSKRLPEYMLPGRMVRLEKMPHNANGKIDRKQLADST